jgi:hypothetical protein
LAGTAVASCTGVGANTAVNLRRNKAAYVPRYLVFIPLGDFVKKYGDIETLGSVRIRPDYHTFALDFFRGIIGPGVRRQKQNDGKFCHRRDIFIDTTISTDTTDIPGARNQVIILGH